MAGKQKGLGRGLSALMGDTVLEQRPAQLEIDVNLIDVCKNQPRKTFDEEKLAELADSIRLHGIIQPLILKQTGSRYMIIAGERRFRAARMAGMKMVPAILKDIDEKQVLELSIIENIQREDLNPIEEALAIELLMDEHGFTQEVAAERLGRSRSAVANTLRLLHLPDSVQSMVIAGSLSAGHARTLLPLRDEELISIVARRVADKGLSVRDTEEYVKKMTQPPKNAREPKAYATNPEFRAAAQELSESLETRVNIIGGEQRGKIQIEYFSREQLESLYTFLKSANR